MRGLVRMTAMLLCGTGLAACQQADTPEEVAENNASALEATTNESVDEAMENLADVVGEVDNTTATEERMSGPPSEPFITGTPPPPPPPNSR